MVYSQVKNNPFPGIRSFDVSEHELFFGREMQVNEIIEKLNEKRFISVIGASGSGKSSLMRAGVIPELFNFKSNKEDSDWLDYVIFRPGDSPIENLGSALYDVFNNKNYELSLTASEINTTLASSPAGLTKILSSLNIDKSKKIILVIDQFEEIFRYHQARKDVYSKEIIGRFIELLLNARQDSNLKIYITLIMRSDFIDDCAEYKLLFDLIKEGNYLVPKMNEADLINAVTKPVMLSNAHITDRLVERLINDVNTEQEQLPILQHALMRTWNYWMVVETENNSIDIPHYEAIGTVNQALSIHGEEIYNSLPNERSKQITEKIFKALTELGPDGRGIRRPTTLGEICQLAKAAEDEIADIAEMFRNDTCAFLMPASNIQLQADTVLDISHESIMRVWVRLRDWVEEEMKSAQLYLRLAETSRLYQEGKAGLWVNPELQVALKWQQENKPNKIWASRYDPEFERAVTFLDYSRRENDLSIEHKENQQKRRLKRARLFAIFLGTASFISLIFLIIALNLKFIAESSEKKALEKELLAIQESKLAAEEKKKAVIQKRISEQQQQIAEQQKIITEEQKVYAIEQQKIAEINARIAEQQRKLAEEAKIQAIRARDEADLQREEALVQKGIAEKQKKIADEERDKAEKSGKNAYRLRMLAIARTIAIQSVKLFSSKKGDLPALLAMQAYEFNKKYGGYINDPDIYEALSLVAATKIIYRDHKDAVRDVVISNKGRLMASCSEDGIVKLWSLIEPQKKVQQNLNISGIGFQAFRCLAFSAGDSYIAAGTFSGEIVVWNISQKDSDPILLKGHSSIINSLSFSKNGNILVSGSSDGTIREWNLDDLNGGGKIIYNSQSKIYEVLFNPDGFGLAVGMENGKIYYFRNYQNPVNPVEYSMENKPVMALAFNSDGNILAAGNSHGGLKLWLMGKPGSLPIEFIGHLSWISKIIFIPKSKSFASASFDGTIRIWDYESNQQQPIVIRDHDGWIYGLTVTPGGEYLVSSGSDKTIRYFETVSSQIAQRVCKSVSRNMTKTEWNEYVGSDIEFEKTCPNLP